MPTRVPFRYDPYASSDSDSDVEEDWVDGGWDDLNAVRRPRQPAGEALGMLEYDIDGPERLTN